MEYLSKENITFDDVLSGIFIQLKECDAQQILNLVASQRVLTENHLYNTVYYDTLAVSQPMNYTPPKERKFSLKFLNELPEHPIYNICTSLETDFKNYIYYFWHIFTVKKKLMSDLCDWLIICMAKNTACARTIYMNVNPYSPYYEMFVETNDTHINYVAHSYDSFQQFWIESACYEVIEPSSSTYIIYNKILNTHEKKSIYDNISNTNVNKLSETNQLYSKLKKILSFDENINIYGIITGLYYVFGVTNSETNESILSGAVYSLLEEQLITHGRGYYPGYPIITWEDTYIQLRHILIQYGDDYTILPTIKKYVYSKIAFESVIRSKMIEYATIYGIPSIYADREVLAFCDICYSCIGIDSVWKRCIACKNFDVCSDCGSSLYSSKLHCTECDIYYNQMKTMTSALIPDTGRLRNKPINPVY